MEPTASTNSSLIPAAIDILLGIPRLAHRAGSFALYHMPESMENIAGKIFNGGSIIADATAQQTVNSTITNTSTAFVRSTGVAGLDAAFREGTEAITSSTMFGYLLQGVSRIKSFGGVFSYLTSRWALATFTVAIILNRTQFYASSREHLQLRWYMRLAIFAVPIASLLVQLLRVLQALRCQTSPDFALIRYGDPLKQLSIDFGGDGGFLYQLSSTLLFWQDDSSSCAARQMSLTALDQDKSLLRGSMSLLFSFFFTLCTSQLFETLACALQGKQPMPETGMTLFEHSLAFAECEAMISSALGFGFFSSSKADGAGSPPSGESVAALVSRSEILQRLNVPPEVLLVCLISCFSHLSSAILAVTGLRHRVRLANTAIWACCYMSAFVWSFVKILTNPVETISDLGVLRFPTVCIVGFIPHLLILLGTLICAIIYGLALLITALSVPDQIAAGLSFRQRLSWAYTNLQANVQFSSASNIRIKMSEDFYTTLLKVGFNVLTAASEAVYLNEGNRIRVAQMTWVEQRRIDQLAANLDQRKATLVPAELLSDGIARGVRFTDHQNAAIGPSPYARERTSRPSKLSVGRPGPNDLDSGLGLAQRRNRMQLTLDFIAGMFWLLIGIQAQFVLNVLQKFGLEHRPSWLMKAAGVAETQRHSAEQATAADNDSLYFLMPGEDGKLVRPRDRNVDVEGEARRRLLDDGNFPGEDSLSERLYSWWHRGGWLGELDNSGDYEASNVDDDTTSMISMSTDDSVDDDDDGDDASGIEESGRRTPTQQDPYGDDEESIAGSDAGMDMSELSRLLNPRTAADRHEARLLAQRLQSNGAMTRSQYRRAVDHNRSQLLAGLRGPSRLQHTEEEEARDLEQFILDQRSKAKPASANAQTWESGAEGMGVGGPQCVVCQSAPRTILVWPCGCLVMCDGCRVGLAARNFSKCITCRTDIAAYSRLYVP